MKRQRTTMTIDEQIRLLCLQMSRGDVLEASRYRDWIVSGTYPKVPEKREEAGKVVTLRPDGPGDVA